MSPKIVVPGTVRNGVVVPEQPEKLSEGVRVLIVANGTSEMAEFQADLEAWDRLSDEAWNHILELEKEAQS